MMESGSPTAEQIDTDYPVGHAARDIGVRAYDVTRSQNGFSVFFLHKDNSRQGTLTIKGFGEGDGIFMELRRSNEVLAVTWNRNIGDFTLDAEERSAHFWIKERKWVTDDEASWQILGKYKSDIELMIAIALDFTSTAPESKLESDCGRGDVSCSNPSSITGGSGTPCDYSLQIRKMCIGEAKSIACWCAKKEVTQWCCNSACWGCCDWMSQHCDCACLIEDYFCECAITGFPCKVD